MPIMEFTYTKSPTDVTTRTYIPLVKPTDKYFGIDITELDYEDQALIAAEVEQSDLDRQSRVNEIMEKYDIKHMYRSFIPSKMSSIIEEV